MFRLPSQVKTGASWLLLGLLALGISASATAPRSGRPSRSTGGNSAERFGALMDPARRALRRPSVPLGRTGTPAAEASRPFSAGRVLRTVGEVESLGRGDLGIGNSGALVKALPLAAALRAELHGFEGRPVGEREAEVLNLRAAELRNLEGLAIKGSRHAKAYRPQGTDEISGAATAAGLRQAARPEGGTTKTNTGWILDQHVYDPEAYKTYPTLNRDYKRYDEGRNDIAIGHSDHPGSGSMFGWVWQVQSFYWSDTTLVSDHANASYCLMVLVSQDGGFTWQLYEILYDPTGAGHTASLDMTNPKLAMDVTGAHDRFYIAYEVVNGESDHDVYVYSETSELDGGTADAQDVGVGTSLNMECNPAIASDYRTDETSYRVVAYEYAYSATDHDIMAAQSTGDGSTWTSAVAVAATSAMEANPALSPGCTGDGDTAPYAAYMHLAYNCDTYPNLLLNPGFESGNDGSWTMNSTGDINCSGAYSRSGTCAAWLARADSSADYIYQAVTIPSDAAAAEFKFYLKITSAESTVAPYDYLYVEVLDTGGALLQTLHTFSNQDKNTYASYVPVSYDLSAYLGQQVRLQFRATSDSSYVTSFFIDDSALVAAAPSVSTGAEIRYRGAPHPGATPYPDGLAAASPLTVLASAGTPAWAYGAPAIAASHGGSPTITGGRLVVAADQLVPADQPGPGDPQRYQLCFAVNMCNGGDSCGDLAGCSPARSSGWNSYYFNDPAADYRFPALVVDGVSWVEGTSGVPQNGIASWPEIFLAYYFREKQSASDYGSVQMLMTDASDERCDGFASGAWYLLTAAPRASDDDDRVMAEQGTIAAFNYFYGWPGVTFNKRLNHPGASENDDVYFTTLGDNYVIDTLSGGSHITAWWDYYGTSYFGPWTYPWPAGYQMTLTVDATANDGGKDYVFSSWSTGERTEELTILTNYCGYAGSCPETSINALYNEVGAAPLRVPYTATPTRAATSNHGLDMTVTWDSSNCASSNYHIIYGKGEGLANWTADGGVCALGASGEYTWAGVPDPATYASRFLWFLVVGDNGAGTEGSWGLTYPAGAEEGGTSPSNVCGMTNKDLSGTCGTP